MTDESGTGRDMAGFVALVTGAAGGMGRSHVDLIRQRGGTVVACDLKVDRDLTEALGRGDMALELDVTDEQSWTAALRAVSDTYGRLDGLVNNAGIVQRGCPVNELSLDEYRRVVEVNQIGVFLGIKHGGDVMRAAGNGGSIVNISSNAGSEGVQGMSAYSSSKWAVRGLTKTAAIDYAPHGIRVNCVLPGIIRTAMVPVSDPPRPQAIRRLGEPVEVSSLVVYLLSPASSYCTGGDFPVDGGVTTGVAWRADGVSTPGAPSDPEPRRGIHD